MHSTLKEVEKWRITDCVINADAHWIPERCDCKQEAQRKEQERQKMIFVGRNGQMTFSLTKEERVLEKAVV